MANVADIRRVVHERTCQTRHGDESFFATALLSGVRPKTKRQSGRKYRKKYIQKLRSNMRYNTTLGDDNATKELVQLLIVADGELQVARNDTKIANASMITCAKSQRRFT